MCTVFKSIASHHLERSFKVKSEVMSFAVVIRQVLRKVPVNDSRVLWERIEALFLYRAIEAFEMRVVVGLSNSRVSVFNTCSFRERHRELASIVRLQHLHRKGCCFFHTSQEAQSCPRIRSLTCPGMREPGTHIQSGEYVHPRTIRSHEVNSVHLYQITRFFNVWAAY
jgi:hypothetical protein